MRFWERPKASLFELWREDDFSGISGVGHVLDGVVFPDGTTVVRWKGKNPSTSTFKSYKHFERVHVRYHGRLTIKWVDGFNGIDFLNDFISDILTKLGEVKTTQHNKYLLAKMKLILLNKVTQLQELRNGKQISLKEGGGESPSSVARTSFGTESHESAPESDVLPT